MSIYRSYLASIKILQPTSKCNLTNMVRNNNCCAHDSSSSTSEYGVERCNVGPRCETTATCALDTTTQESTSQPFDAYCNDTKSSACDVRCAALLGESTDCAAPCNSNANTKAFVEALTRVGNKNNLSSDVKAYKR